MYFYQFGFYSYEESDCISLVHDNKYNKKEFNDFIIEATLELLFNRREKYSQLNYDEEEINDVDFCLDMLEKDPTLLDKGETKEEYIKKYGHVYWSIFSNIFSYVVEIMIEKYRFKKLEYTQSSWVDGWEKIVKKDRTFGEDDLILDKIREEYWKRKGKK